MCSPLEYDVVEGNLVIKQISYPAKIITFDKNMIYNYWSKKWELDRFIVYVQKRKDIMAGIQ